MAETNKMTQAKAIDFVLATYGEVLPADVKGKIEDIAKSLEKKANAPRAQSAEVKENAKLRQAILDTMVVGQRYRISDLIAKVPGLETASTHKVSALLTPMKNNGLIIREEEKRIAYFRKVEA
jgi:hypothetical protein